MFIVSLSYIRPISEVEKHFEAHMTYIEKYYNLNKFIASGRKVPRTGGYIFIQADTAEEAEKIVTEDPFVIHKVADYTITEFIANRAHSSIEALTKFI